MFKCILLLSFIVSSRVCQAPISPANCLAIKVHQLSLVIANEEGWNNKDSLVYSLNNPGALTFVKQRNAKLGSRNFAHFSSADAGWKALRKDLESKLKRNMSLRAIIYRWAPPSENNTEAYLHKVEKAMIDINCK